jgi:hypothetical protein
VDMDEAARLAGALAGVRRTAPGGRAQWRYHGRLVARQLDDGHLVIAPNSTTAPRCCGSSPAPSASRPGTPGT